MHPAASIVLFTTASGAGYGLLLLLGLAGPLELLPPERGLGILGLGLALALIGGGLAASTFHLKHPERAWRAFSQWRSSWLSREGVAALVTFVPALVFAFGWVVFESTSGVWGIFGVLASLGAVATVVSTAMIYRSLATIRQWHNAYTVPLYIGFALVTGGLWLNLVTHLVLVDSDWIEYPLLAALPLVWAVKLGYWQHIDTTKCTSTPESATGLGSLGQVRLLEPPHTGENYLLREMGYTVARKHAQRLRRLALVSGLAVPVVFVVLAAGSDGGWASVAALAAAASGSLGVVIERWLFFAEATHTQMLYYGARAA